MRRGARHQPGFATDGYAVLPALLTGWAVLEALREAMALIEEGRQRDGAGPANVCPHVTLDASRHAVAGELLADPRLLRVAAEAGLGPQLALGPFLDVRAPRTGCGQQPGHRDRPLLPGRPVPLTVLVGLVETGPDNGATAVWPGTHRRVLSTGGASRWARGRSPVQPTLHPGDGLVLAGHLRHAGTTNHSRLLRPLLLATIEPRTPHPAVA